MADSDNFQRPVRLTFGRSVLCPYDESVLAAPSTIKLPAESAHVPGAGSWATFPATSAVTTTYGSFSFSVLIDNLGTNAKPIIVGVVPRHFTAFDAKLAQQGWGLSTAGKAYAYNATANPKADVAGVSVAAGDRITVKVDCGARPSITFVIEAKKTKKTSEHTMKVPSLGGAGSWIVPAVSVASPGAQVTLETLTDTTPLEVFATRTVDGEDLCFECDALGSLFLRMWRRMGDKDTVKTSAGTWTKTDVRLRAVLLGSQTTPAWGRSPLAGVFEVDPSHRKMAMLYSELCRTVATDAADCRALVELVTQPPSASRMLISRCASPVALALAMTQNAAPPTPAAASPAFGSDGDVRDQLAALAARVAVLETQGGGSSNGHAASPPGSEPTIKRTQSVAKGNTAVAGRRASRATSVSKGSTTKRPMSKQATRPEVRKTPIKPASINGANKSNALHGLIEKVVKLQAEISELGQKGSPTDDDLARVEKLKKELSSTKLQVAKDLAALPADKKKEAHVEEARGDLQVVLQELVAEGDHHTGNVELFRAIVEHVPMDVATLARDDGWAGIAAYDGSVEFLKVILNIPKLDIDLVELVQCAVFNQSFRIPVTLMLLEFWDQLNMASVEDDIAEAWQEFFEDVCSAERAKPREDRSGRPELIQRMLALKHPKVDPTKEGSDGQTVFSRAAREGDLDLMTLLIEKVDDKFGMINHVSSVDKTTPLIQAVHKNQRMVVEVLSSFPGVNTDHDCGEGTALQIATTLKRDPSIVRALSMKR